MPRCFLNQCVQNRPKSGRDFVQVIVLQALPYTGVCAALAPCQTGTSTPKQGKLFLCDPVSHNPNFQQPRFLLPQKDGGKVVTNLDSF